MKRVLVFFIVGVVLFGACSANSANAQNANNEQRIIGTWVAQGGELFQTWVFNANGNLTIQFSENLSSEYRFVIVDSKLFFAPVNIENRNYWIYNISISSDGRTLILEGTFYYLNTDNEREPRAQGFLFTKK